MHYRALMVLSVLTSWAARGSAAVYTLFAFPFILNAIGHDRFAIFLYALNFPSWLALAMLGSPGTVAYLLSRSAKKGRSTLFRARFGNVLLPPAVLISLGIVGVALMVLTGVIGQGLADPHFTSETLQAILISLVLTSLIIFGGVFETFALGLGKIHVFNLMRICSVIISLIGFLILPHWTTLVPYYLIVYLLPQVVLLYFLGARMIRTAGASPIFHWRLARRVSSRLNRGVFSGFFLMTLPFIINVQLGATLIGLLYGVSDTALLLVLLRILIFSAAFFGAITGAAWPLLGRTYTFGEHAVFRKNAAQLVAVCSIVAFCAFGTFYFFGPRLLDLWLPDVVKGNVDTVHAFAAYLALYLWNTLWLAILSATGRVVVAGVLSAVEAAIGVSLALYLFADYNATGYMLGLVIGSLLSTSSIAPIVGLRLIARAPDRPPDGVAQTP